MSNESFKVRKSLNIQPTASPTVDQNGDIAIDTVTNKIQTRVNGVTDSLVTETGSVTLTNKTLTAPVITSPTGIVKGDVGLGNVDNTSDATKNAAVATLTNKTLTSPIISTISNTGTITIPTATGTLATLAGIEVLSNKDIDGGTASNANRITIPKNIKTNLDGLTRKEASVVYGTDTKTLYYDDGISLKKVGSGSGDGINYILNPGAEDDTTGWQVYTDYVNGSGADILGDSVVVAKTSGGGFVQAGDFPTGTRVKYTGLVPYGGLTLNNNYFIDNIGGHGTNSNWGLQLRSTLGGSIIDITSTAGTGLSGFLPYNPISGVSGNWGAPTLTWTRSTSSSLIGDASFLLTKGAVSTLGEGVSYDFTIDRAFQGQPLSLNYVVQTVSGTYVNGDLAVWIYDKTNKKMIQPTAYMVSSSSLGGPVQPLVFQAPSNSTDFRLIVHSSTDSTNSYVLKFDGFKVTPQVVSTGAVTTDWTSYTPTLANFGTVTNVAFYSRRVGDSLEVKGKWTNGTTVAATASITLGYAGGNGNVIQDGTKIATGQLVGHAVSSVSSSSQFGLDVLGVANSNAVNYSVQNSTIAAASAANGNAIGTGSGANMSLFLSVPIVGWSSNTIVSDSANTRVVRAQVAGLPNAALASATLAKLTWASQSAVQFDTHGAWNVVTGDYVVKVPGYYTGSGVTEVLRLSGGATQSVTIQFRNSTKGVNTAIGRSGWISAGSETLVVSGDNTVYADAGDVLNFYIYAEGTGLSWNAGITSTCINIVKDDGPAQIQAATVVACRYNSSTASTLNGAVTIPFANKDFDTTGSFNGATGVFTAPAPGVYAVSGLLTTSTPSWVAGNAISINLNKNNSVGNYMRFFSIPASGILPYSLTFSDTIYLNAGETLKIVTDASLASTISGQADRNYLNIRRLSGVN